MSTALLVIGFLVSFAGGVMILIAAFRVSIGWGLACLFIPFVSIYFIIKNWDATKKGFFLNLAGTALIFIAVLMGQPATSAPETATTETRTDTQETHTEPAALTYTPGDEPVYIAPPATDTAPPKPKLERVWADSSTRLFYPEQCKKHPENAYLVSRSVALMQGYTAAGCP